MAEKKPTVITVKEATLVAMTQACSGNAQSARRVANTSGKAWGTTVLWLNEKKDLKSFDATKDVKDIAKDLRESFANAFLVEWDDAVTEGHKEELTPESVGKNARTGKLMVILDKDVQPKWSSWEETKLPIAYCGDIARIIKAGIVDEVLPGGNKVMGRTDALQRAKTPESPLETIERSAKLIGRWEERRVGKEG